jgi:drug/metabolite transporter (DMT)-like permease
VRPSILVLLVVLSVIWGSAFMLVEVVLEDVAPLTIVAGRLSLAFVFLFAVLRATGQRLPMTRRAWTAYFVMGVVNNVWPFAAITWGQQHIESSLAAILTASMPISTVLLAHYTIRERMTPDRVAGILVGFAGVFVLIGADLRDITESGTLGQLAVLGGVLGYSIGTVFARRYLQDADPTETAAGQMMVGTAVAVPLALAVDRPFDLAVSAKAASAWIALGILPSAIAYLLFFRLVREISATQASMVSYLIPITAVFLGAFVLDERLAATSFLGLALIVLGVWVVNGGIPWVRGRLGLAAGPVEVEPMRGGAGEDGPRPPP